jgi:1,4-alpha-glucan branching enzyme
MGEKEHRKKKVNSAQQKSGRTRSTRKKTMTTDIMKHDFSLITDHDIYLYKEASHYKLYDKLGSHVVDHDGNQGTYFAVWAPNAEFITVVGDFNGWNPESHPLKARHDESGIWEGFIPGIGKGAIYKYNIQSRFNMYRTLRSDPYAVHCETPPRTGSVVWDLTYEWNDDEWMRNRHRNNSLEAPISIYEVHLGSWMRVPEDGNRSLSYRELAPKLAAYVKELGFTHVEFLPVMEHPFGGSWGYQITGYFAPTSRFGTPQDFMYLIDHLHQNGIGVIMDWVPSHFPSDEHGLVYFDGTHLYEHQDPRKGFHPDWKSYIFNYDRNEVRAFLLSSALYWLEKYHVDGLRVDAVASMLYLNYSRKEGEWIPNHFGGNENLGAISLLKRFNEVVYENFPDTQTIAEESTAWPMVSRPVYVGGLGFGMKWNMGWMHDTLEYFSKDPVHRKFHHHSLTFSLIYAFNENFTLPISHDEVVHGKSSLLGKMPGDDWQKYANLRALLAYMYAHPGKKLLFMGSEIGQWDEWKHDSSIDWHLLQYHPHRGVQHMMKDLNTLYKSEPCLHEIDFDFTGFEWVDLTDWENSIISFLRKGKSSNDIVFVVCNLTPVYRENYRLGVPRAGYWQEIFNSDSSYYGGTDKGNGGGLDTTPVPAHGHYQSLNLILPPLSVSMFRNKGG